MKTLLLYLLAFSISGAIMFFLNEIFGFILIITTFVFFVVHTSKWIRKFEEKDLDIKD